MADQSLRAKLNIQGRPPGRPTFTALLFIGAMGKSAQVPLPIRCPRLEEGPRHSALIHAATMSDRRHFMVGPVGNRC